MEYSLNEIIDSIKVAQGNVYMISELKENIILSEIAKQNFDKEYELIIDNFLPSTSRMSLHGSNEK